MKNEKILLLIFVFLISLYSVNSIDTFSCLPTNVIEGGTQTCETNLASGGTERNQAYNITWYNTTSQEIAITGCSFVGTTADQNNPPNILQECTIPTDWGATTDGVVNFSIDGLDSVLFNFNITEETSIDLIITDIITEIPCYVGEFCGMRGTVIHAKSGQAVIGAVCTGDILQLQGGNLVPIAVQGTRTGASTVTSSYAGHFLLSPLLTQEAIVEGDSYALEFRCVCRAGKDSCALDNGTLITNPTSTTPLNKTLRGIGTTTLDISRWLQTSTSIDLSTIIPKQRNSISVNVTNNRSDIRVPMEITFDCRLNREDASLRRIKSPFFFPECNRHGECIVNRGIDAGIIQEQGTDVIIEEHPFLQGRTTEAYCSTKVKIVDIIGETVSYSTTSSVFNIISDELDIESDWQWIEDLKLNSIVNLSNSKYDDFNGTGIGNIDVDILTEKISIIEKESRDIRKAFEIFNLIKNVTVSNSTSQLVEHVDFELEFLEDGHVEIELRDVSLDKSDGLSWWNLTIEFYDLKLRDTLSYENQTVQSINLIEATNNASNLSNINIAQVEGEIGWFKTFQNVLREVGDGGLGFIDFTPLTKRLTTPIWVAIGLFALLLVGKILGLLEIEKH